MSTPDFRIGFGTDSHRLTDGAGIIVGGVRIPYTKSFVAHSDGDLLYHALTDALLGAIGAGDIGTHFPDTDAKWQGKESSYFVSEALKIVLHRGYRVSNLDATVVAQQPKLAPFIGGMRENIAKLLGLEIENCNIKAKTAEKIGALGREEGMMAYVSILLVKA